MANTRQVKAGELLFKEGDSSEAMYVVKKGRFSVFKVKGTQEVELAEVKAGQMIGEMAFFDQKPRSASIKAVTDAEVIELPFKALQAQFDTFPEWLKAIVKTINEHLREANKKIKNLEQGQTGPSSMSPYQASKLCAILMFVANKWGTPAEDGSNGIDVKSGLLRKFTIQVFQEPTSKMQTVMGVLQGLGILKQEELGEGRVRITLMERETLDGFVDWLNEYLFTEEAKRVTIDEPEMKFLKALLHFGRKKEADPKGQTKINLMEMQNESMKELGYLVGINDCNSLIKKGLASEKIQEKEGTSIGVDVAEIGRIYPFWQIYYGLQLGH